jgi:hypothetical protein
MMHRITAKGLQEIVPAELKIGQVVWLHGCGRFSNEGQRKAVYKIRETDLGKIYHLINLDTFRREQKNACSILPESELNGIGTYYTPGDIASEEEIKAALAKTAEVEAADLAAAEEEKRKAEADELACLKKYSHLIKADGKVSSHALGAKNIRKELKQAFPGQKFSVKSESYSMGCSIRITWTDGPTTEEVEAITKKYQYGSFNGMEDIYEYNQTAFTGNFGSAKYVFATRTISDEFREEVRATLPDDYQGNIEQAIYRAAAKISRYQAPKKAAPADVPTPDGITVTYNDKKNGIEIRFPGKPEKAIRDEMKALRFRWHGKFKFWYAKQTEQTKDFADKLMKGEK